MGWCHVERDIEVVCLEKPKASFLQGPDDASHHMDDILARL